jgi:ABC-type uncharacterized transport system permease subunit
VALPSRVGLINVGVEGQLYMGACLAAWGALTFTALPPWVLLCEAHRGRERPR